MVLNLKKIFSFTFAVALFFVGLNKLLNFSQSKLELYSSTIISPFLFAQKKAVENYKDRTEFEKVLDFYKQENENLKAEIIELKSLNNFVEQTTELIEFSHRYNTNKKILAQVVLKVFNPENSTKNKFSETQPNNFYILDVGKSKGIEPDMVVVYKNCLVGRVQEVYDKWCKVTLIIDSTCKVAAYSYSNNVHGIFVGDNSLEKAKLTLVNHLDVITPNDLVLSSGEGLIFPRGFGLGNIKSYELEGLSYNITIEPILNFKEINYCFIIQKGAELLAEESENLVKTSLQRNNVPQELGKLNEQKR